MNYDIIVIGGGHAGIEAAHASAKMGAQSLLITTLCEQIGAASCNPAIGGLAKKKPDGFAAYALRTYFSTAVGQFTDNMVFALIVGRVFFGWSMLQCVTCSAVGMAAELICEVIFSPVGYAVCRKWKKENVGSAYLEYRATLISGKGNAKA